MSELRLQLTASEDDTMQIINRLSALGGIESVEEIADLMPHMDDPDSSSAGLPDDMGPGTHLILINAETDDDIRRALEVAESSARALGIVLEVVVNE
ncbi:MAG: hypothetical protein DCF27_11705 [Lysobacteraceae bacterium]|jgi:hypothetical protein|nr:MAG: hypothetical protein DCF27_11705 [Xanthomonadaceae bacterium]